MKVEPRSFFQDLMKESPAHQMIKRGYAIVPISPDLTRIYGEFAESLALFCKQPLEEKLKFAQLKNGTKMDDSRFTPNQYHGYSQMLGLKEQFMIRAAGRNTDLYLPAQVGPDRNFADLSLRLYEMLDQLGRRHLHAVSQQLGLRASAVDRVLDPVNKRSIDPLLEDSDLGAKCATDYMFPGFISTSILDVFHYFNNFRSEEADKDDQFHNNHAYVNAGCLG